MNGERYDIATRHTSAWVLLPLLLLLATALLIGGCGASTSRSSDGELGITIRAPGESIKGAIEAPRPGAILPPQFTVTGWAIDAWLDSRGPGLDGVEIHRDDCSEQTKLAEAEYGHLRDDIVKGLHLDATYLASGFSASVGPLDAGNYKLAVCARHPRWGSLEIATLAVTVSLNMVGIDLGDDEFVSLPLTISGWAVAFSSDPPPGVDIVRFMRGSCDSGELLAEAQPSGPREDVVSALGLSEEYLLSGFAAEVTSGLPNGRQTIAVCANRFDTGETFSKSRAVYVTQPEQQVGIFQPTPDEETPSPLRVAGWAVDYTRGQGEGPGVARVEIWQGPCETGTMLASARMKEPVPGVRDELGLDVSYTNLGFVALIRDLEPGQHTLTVCAVSEATATYFGKTLRVTIEAADTS